MNYTNERPKVSLPRPDLSVLCYTKSKHWEYEKEWRLIRRPYDKKHDEPDVDGFPIYLFNLPSQAIKEIILGCRSELIGEPIRVAAEKRFPWVGVKQARMSDDKYELIIE